MADDKILVRLTKKFANRIFHEFHNDHPHKTSQGGELLVTGDRVAQAARTPGVLHAIMQGMLEEVRDSNVAPTPDPVDVLDVVNGVVKPGFGGESAEATPGEAASRETPEQPNQPKAARGGK